LGKAEDKRAAIIAEQAARQQAEQPNTAAPAKRKMNWAASAPLRPRRGRPPMGGGGGDRGGGDRSGGERTGGEGK